MSNESLAEDLITLAKKGHLFEAGRSTLITKEALPLFEKAGITLHDVRPSIRLIAPDAVKRAESGQVSEALGAYEPQKGRLNEYQEALGYTAEFVAQMQTIPATEQEPIARAGKTSFVPQPTHADIVLEAKGGVSAAKGASFTDQVVASPRGRIIE